MRIAVTRESEVEPRVAATPETVKKLIALAGEVVIESGAGIRSGILDSDYEAAGARIAHSAAEAAGDADVVLKVRRPPPAEAADYKRGALVIAVMDPYGNEAALQDLADLGVTTFAMELMPRITRA